MRPQIAIPSEEVQITAIRAQGAGGQNVNKVANAAHLRFDIAASSLPAEVRERLLKLDDRRISKEGIVIIKAQEFRSLEKNRTEAMRRLAGTGQQRRSAAEEAPADQADPEFGRQTPGVQGPPFAAQGRARLARDRIAAVPASWHRCHAHFRTYSMLRLTEIKLPLDHPADALRAAICQRLGIAEDELVGHTVFRRSFDARKKTAIALIYTVDVEVSDETEVLARLGGERNIMPTPDTTLPLRRPGARRPVGAPGGHRHRPLRPVRRR